VRGPVRDLACAWTVRAGRTTATAGALDGEDLGGGRTRTAALSVVESLGARDMVISSGMEVGVVEG